PVARKSISTWFRPGGTGAAGRDRRGRAAAGARRGPRTAPDQGRRRERGAPGSRYLRRHPMRRVNVSKFVRPAAEGADPFGTVQLRRGVLDAWAASPARFREDANAEEDLALGGYRDRLVVELAQNAADAAARAGVPGRLRLTLRDGVLVAANTGEPAVVGRDGGVRWSLAEARGLAHDAAGASPALGDEIRRRDGHVPLLRLPFAAEGSAPAPYDTAVILPLRDTAAADLAERLLHAVDDALLLALPGLEEIVVEDGDS